NQEAKQGISDFNDIFLNKGLDEVKKQLNFIDFHNKLKAFKSMEKTQPEKEITRQ
ncbi:hypothetical protein P3932_002010, partial [Campylobacter coli]|nr:hypothetical protein [Campylobacter coli]EIW6677614.1 hypothetical protein [Campylobacter coli]EKP7758523.1 hypothetical protein [Campylobacter coli]